MSVTQNSEKVDCWIPFVMRYAKQVVKCMSNDWKVHDLLKFKGMLSDMLTINLASMISGSDGQLLLHLEFIQ